MRFVDVNLLENLMREWGRWERQQAIIAKLGYGAGTLASKSSGAAAMISDDDALSINAEMAALRVWYPCAFDVLDYFYRKNMTKVEVANKLGVDRRQVTLLLGAGTAFVARGVMSGEGLVLRGKVA